MKNGFAQCRKVCFSSRNPFFGQMQQQPEASVDAQGWLILKTQRGVLRTCTRDMFIMFEVSHQSDAKPLAFVDSSNLLAADDVVILDFCVTTFEIERGLLRVSNRTSIATDPTEAPLLLHACSVHAMKDVCSEMPHIRVKTVSALALLPANLPHTVQVDWDTSLQTYCVSILYKPAYVYDANGNIKSLQRMIPHGLPIKLHTESRDAAVESVSNYRIVSARD